MTHEADATFPCFGSTCSVSVSGDGSAGTAEQAVQWAQQQLEQWHHEFTRFDPDSGLSRLNADRRHAVPVSPTLARFADLAVKAAALTRGLVDATLLGEVESAGYSDDLNQAVDLAAALVVAPERAPAAPRADQRWRLVRVDPYENIVFRPPGVRLDSGGLANGLFCDLLAETLGTHHSYAVDCDGHVSVGGAAGRERAIRVASPFDPATVLHTFHARDGAAATSGVARSWTDDDGHPLHHLLDPATGHPAFTGIVQVTALAPRGVVAETCAKAALLRGPDGAEGWLPEGGVIVFDDGTHRVVEPAVASQESPSFL
jgi:thiamine biosynthesis lipoprotein